MAISLKKRQVLVFKYGGSTNAFEPFKYSLFINTGKLSVACFE